jgi:hypothetical protein
MNWFTAKIKYLKQDPEDGTIKKVSEVYILNALSHTEAEARLQGVLEEFIPEYNLLKLDKTNINQVIIDKTKDNFFKVKIAFTFENPDNGKTATENEVFIVQAQTSKEAIAAVEDYLHSSKLFWEVSSVSKTKIVEAFPYVEEKIV